MIRCRELAGLLVDYFADALPPRETERIRAHLEWCPACSAEVHIYQQVLRATRQLPNTPVPAPLLNRLRQALRDSRP